MNTPDLVMLCIAAAMSLIGSLIFGLGVEGWISGAAERRRLAKQGWYSWGNIEDLRRARMSVMTGLLATIIGAGLVAITLLGGLT